MKAINEPSIIGQCITPLILLIRFKVTRLILGGASHLISIVKHSKFKYQCIIFAIMGCLAPPYAPKSAPEIIRIQLKQNHKKKGKHIFFARN
jgi:hypothetical protein